MFVEEAKGLEHDTPSIFRSQLIVVGAEHPVQPAAGPLRSKCIYS